MNRRYIYLGVIAVVAVICVITGVVAVSKISRYASSNESSFGMTAFGSGNINYQYVSSILGRGDYWSVDVNFFIRDELAEKLGGAEKVVGQLEEDVRANLSREYADSVKYETFISEKREEDTIITLHIQSNRADIMNQVLFIDMDPVFNILNGPISLSILGKAERGSHLTLDLASNPSTGYTWVENKNSEYFETKKTLHENIRASAGTPQVESFIVGFARPWEAAYTVEYLRPWEDRDYNQQSRIEMVLDEVESKLEIINPHPESYYPDEPPPSDDPPPEEETPEPPPEEPELTWADYPTYDWTTRDNRFERALNLYVKDQGGCGSCWAFAATGAMEAAFMVQTGTMPKLSEQYLLSCNKSGMDCDGGWVDVSLQYYAFRDGKLSNPPGAIYDASLPYDPVNRIPCQLFAPKPYKLYQVREAVPLNLQSLDEKINHIKSKIYEYGPVVSWVCASDSFKRYRRGVYDANDCQKGNHFVLIVGWDDTTQTWRIKNSWGPNWGEGGYMSIKWENNRIGSGVNYVIVEE